MGVRVDTVDMEEPVVSNPSYEEREKEKRSLEDWDKIAEDAEEVLVARLLLELCHRIGELEKDMKIVKWNLSGMQSYYEPLR